MARLDINFYSLCLRRSVSFKMFVPDDTRRRTGTYADRKTLLFLHGYNDCAENWAFEDLAYKYNFQVIMPNGENSFYLDGAETGRKYCRFVGEELPDTIETMFCKKLDASNLSVMGISMGGFGALHTGLTYPERFGKIAALSSALIMDEVAAFGPEDHNSVANYEYYRLCFGDLKSLVGSSNDPRALARELVSSGGALPEIYMCCGSEDFLIENNRNMHKTLDGLGISHEYHESPGVHDWPFWYEYVPKAIDWMFG